MSATVTAAKLGMLTLLGASAPVGMQTPDVWLQWGLAGVVVAFVMWRDHQRERRMSVLIERQDAWTRDTLLQALSQNTAALHEVTRTLRAQRDTRRLPTTHGTHGQVHS